MPRLAAIVLSTLLFAVLPLQGSEASHITDRLLAGLYATPSNAEPPKRLLPSGTPLEVLERRKLFSRVKVPDGTEGWVESRFITEEKTAQVMLLEAQARTGALHRQITDLQDQLRDLNARGSSVETAPSATKAQGNTAKPQLPVQDTQSAASGDRDGAAVASPPPYTSWPTALTHLATAGLGMLLGLGAGLIFGRRT